MSNANANVYQLNYHDGHGWHVINEATLRQRLGPSWEYAEWCFDQGKSASVRSVEYRRKTSSSLAIFTLGDMVLLALPAMAWNGSAAN